jgi:hypothetical protein
MADLKDLAGSAVEGASQKAVLSAGKEMARRALEDMTLSPEEKQKRDEERASARKKTLVKWGVIGVGGVVLVLSLMSVLAKLWVYALGLLVVAGIGAAGYFTLKPKIAALKQRATARLEAKKRAEDEAKALEAAEAHKKAVADAARAKQQKLEDELLALKKKAGS